MEITLPWSRLNGLDYNLNYNFGYNLDYDLDYDLNCNLDCDLDCDLDCESGGRRDARVRSARAAPALAAVSPAPGNKEVSPW